MKTLDLNQLEELQGGYKCFFAIPATIFYSNAFFSREDTILSIIKVGECWRDSN